MALSAGIAALWIGHHGRDAVRAAATARGETIQERFRTLVRNTVTRPDAWDDDWGPGIINALDLLNADLDDDARLPPPADPPTSFLDRLGRLLGIPAEEAGVQIESLGLEASTRFAEEVVYRVAEDATLRQALVGPVMGLESQGVAKARLAAIASAPLQEAMMG